MFFFIFPLFQLCYVLLMLLQLVVVSAYPLLLPSLGALFFLPLAILSLLAIQFMLRWLPETRDLSVERIFRRMTLTYSAPDFESDYGTIRHETDERPTSPKE